MVSKGWGRVRCQFHGHLKHENNTGTSSLPSTYEVSLFPRSHPPHTPSPLPPPSAYTVIYWEPSEIHIILGHLSRNDILCSRDFSLTFLFYLFSLVFFFPPCERKGVKRNRGKCTEENEIHRVSIAGEYFVRWLFDMYIIQGLYTKPGTNHFVRETPRHF